MSSEGDLGRLQGFDAFVADQAQPLARTALLLTGDRWSARTLVVDVLTRIALTWPTVRWAKPADSARRGLFASFLSWAGGGTEPAAQSSDGLSAAAPTFRDALGALPPSRRALVVARFHEGVPEAEAAALCRTDPGTARAEIAAAVAELRAHVPGLTAPEKESVPEPEPRTGGWATTWAPPTPEQEQEAPRQHSWTSVPSSVLPWSGGGAAATPTGAADLGPEGEALRRALDALASEMPPMGDVFDQVAGTARRRRSTRGRLVTGVSVVVAALVIVPVVFGATSLISAINEAPDRTTEGPYATSDEDDSSGDALPSMVDAPIRYAYRARCLVDDTEEGRCFEWRVVTAEGRQYVIYDAGVRTDPGGNQLLAITPDGNHIAYYNTSWSDFVVIDRRHSVPEGGDLVEVGQRLTKDTSLAISPSGRWVATGFGTGGRARPTRVRDFTSRRNWTLPRRLHVLAVADDGTVTGTVGQVGGGRPVDLVRMRPNGRVLNRMRLDGPLLAPDLPVAAVASPSGRTLAVVAEVARPGRATAVRVAIVDAVAGRVRGSCLASLPPGTEVRRVHGWGGAREVVVETGPSSRKSDRVSSATAVEVRSCRLRGIALDGRAEAHPHWALGALNES
ncbi:hypothetical protein [Microtetraspora malaysiensis]|uniref:hypothetical protein n=1 Tax=Microtetraspora malaysiensis TaxID=161358 RepID=UPI0008360C46|nr:hypothetical protein [Microtetraspora malaysiensis]